MKDIYERLAHAHDVQDIPTAEKIANKFIGVKGKDNLTILDYAARYENIELVKFLLDRSTTQVSTGKDSRSENQHGQSNGHSRILQMLQDKRSE